MIGATSPNGWPVSPNEGDLDITPLLVANTLFVPGVRGGKVHQVLAYVAGEVHRRVQRLSQVYGNYGYSFRENVNSPGEWSNHASATAIDFNATRNPNGVPTIECFTQAQIDEVHAILAEVDHVVRWGGDYEGTPDSMHFEIDVPPEDLDTVIPVAPIATTQWPIGAPNLDDLSIVPELTPMSISYPTMAAYGLTETAEGQDPYGTAYWLFRPTESARISIDALNSHFTDPGSWSLLGPDVSLTLYELRPDGTLLGVYGSSYWPGGPGHPHARNQGRIFYGVEAGKTYVIETSARADFPWIRTVVRIGDYVPDPDWVQPSDQMRIWSLPAGHHGTGNKVPPVTGKSVQFSPPECERSFGGPAPGLEIDAIACSWKWSRHIGGPSGIFWWSPGNGVEWLGGPGTCPIFNLLDYWLGGGGGTTLLAGWSYYANSTRLDWTIGLGTLVLAPHYFEIEERRNGLGLTNDNLAPYLPTLNPALGEFVEWENEENECELIRLDVSWDQTNDNITEAQLGWYVGILEDGEVARTEDGVYYPLQPPPSGRWGPWGTSTWQAQTGDTPENWAASQDQLGITTGGVGSWRPLAPQYLEAEAIRFSCLPMEMLVDSPPRVEVGTSVSFEESLNGLYMAFRTTVRPSRYRVWSDPGVVELDWAGVTAIEIRPEGVGRVLY